MKIWKLLGFAAVAFAGHAGLASADCVINQRSAQQVRVLDSQVLVIYGGIAGHTMISTLTPIMPGANFAVMKDNFCDFDPQAISMNGEPLAVQMVKHVN